MRHLKLNSIDGIVIFFVIMLLGYSSLAIVYAPPRDPEVPWENDPDISAIADERIVQLWEEIMLTYRRNNPFGLPVVAVAGCRDYTSSPLDSETQEILIDALSHALATESIDWNYVRTVLILMLKGMDPDERVPQLADQLFTVSRSIKMSYDYKESLHAMISLLRKQNSQESAQVLFNACYREYWGTDPMNIPGAQGPEYSEAAIASIRRRALSRLAGISHEISIPFLEALAVAYPETHKAATLEIETGRSVQPVHVFQIDLTHLDVHRALNRALERQATVDMAEQE